MGVLVIIAHKDRDIALSAVSLQSVQDRVDIKSPRWYNEVISDKIVKPETAITSHQFCSGASFTNID